ncbi:hypothetical protein HIM_06480 [Hirsutella minnesotensis 3608]|uniref:Very-long-chain (3R)-3-hydroxyacyl-CoA dehydratase n=1 Tax=Hirsutella minnesotensis 3608 TaxID=1043627 RepID=A0A0F7ZIW3_9HYPO|nr:hypothetical protein HIM_06480 [Hirsutella minnesotensis 3608]
MAASSKSQRPASPLNTGYLVLYNFVSAIAWSVVLGRTLVMLSSFGHPYVYNAVGNWTKWTQTLAAMEVLHSLLGVVRAPLFTTLMQVSSRFLLVWGVVHSYPYLASSPFYSSMLIAWSVTEVIRYSYFALSLSGSLPSILTWLRYNTFFVLYPVGILSECALIFKATTPSARRNPVAMYTLYAILVVYVPGAYILYTHMMAQRQKVMRNDKANDAIASR